MKGRLGCAVFTQRLACLQQQVAVLQAASRAAHDEQLKYQRAHTELQTLTHTLQVRTRTHIYTHTHGVLRLNHHKITGVPILYAVQLSVYYVYFVCARVQRSGFQRLSKCVC